MILANFTKFNLPKYILKEDIKYLTEKKGIPYEFPSKLILIFFLLIMIF